MPNRKRTVLVPVLFLVAVGIPLAFAQKSASKGPACKPLTLTTEEDQKNMMQQLGIQVMRPGPNADEHAPNHANYDEAQANPFPNIPDALTMNSGQKVTTPEMWKKRRAEILEGFDCCVYGRVPKNVPEVAWSVGSVDHEFIGFSPVIAKEVIGHVDNSSCPDIAVNIRMIVVTPANAKGPVPLLILFGPAAFPSPNQPSEE